MAMNEEPSRVISVHEALTKVDNILGRVPIKLEESVDQIKECRTMLMDIVRVYENMLQKQHMLFKDAQVYIKGLEEQFIKSSITIEMVKPESLKLETVPPASG